jgi:hypothetical protein
MEETGENAYAAGGPTFGAHLGAAAENMRALEALNATLAAHGFDRDPAIGRHLGRLFELHGRAYMAAGDGIAAVADAIRQLQEQKSGDGE